MKSEIYTKEALVMELRKLNPGVHILLNTSKLNSIIISKSINELNLPIGFEYNNKNSLTNKGNTKSGAYVMVELEQMQLSYDSSKDIENAKNKIYITTESGKKHVNYGGMKWVTPQELSKKVKLPVTDEFISKFIDLYLSITMQEMENFYDLDDIIYRKINFDFSIPDSSVNEKDSEKLFDKINLDFQKRNDSKDIKKTRQSLTGVPGWQTFNSHYLLGTEKISTDDIAHRFYIGADCGDLYKIANMLYDKFKEAQTPFYFKLDNTPENKRRDRIVVYTTTKFLGQTLQVLEKIVNENPELMGRCIAPSIVMGKISEKIGYASEDVEAKGSYTSNICKAFSDALEKSLNNFLGKHKSLYFIIDGKNIPIIDWYSKSDFIEKKIKTRQLVNMFLKNDKDYKDILFVCIRDELKSNGYNLDNLCMHKKVEKEINQMYSDDNVGSSTQISNTMSSVSRNEFTTIVNKRKVTFNEVKAVADTMLDHRRIRELNEKRIKGVITKDEKEELDKLEKLQKTFVKQQKNDMNKRR